MTPKDVLREAAVDTSTALRALNLGTKGVVDAATERRTVAAINPHFGRGIRLALGVDVVIAAAILAISTVIAVGVKFSEGLIGVFEIRTLLLAGSPIGPSL